MSVTCGYCNKTATFCASSAHIYGGRDFGPVWCCPGSCDAYVGTHPDGSPKGTLANKARRTARRQVHAVFDPLWQDWRGAYPDQKRQNANITRLMRLRAYEWLAHHLNIPFDQTHIAMFDEAQCAQAIAVIAQHAPTAATVRVWAKARRAA